MLLTLQPETRLLDNLSILRYGMAQLAMALAEGLLQVLLISLMVILFGSPLGETLSLCGFTFLLYTLLAWPVGAWLDYLSEKQFSAKAIWQWALLGCLVLTLLFFVFGQGGQTEGFLIFFAAYAFFRVFVRVASLALIPTIVERTQIRSVNALASVMQVLGALSGGLIAYQLQALGQIHGLLILLLLCDGIALLSVSQLRIFSERLSPVRMLSYLRRHRRATQWLGLMLVLAAIAAFFYLVLMSLSFEQYQGNAYQPGHSVLQTLLYGLDVGMFLAGLLLLLSGKQFKTMLCVAAAFLLLFLSLGLLALVSSGMGVGEPLVLSGLLVLPGFCNGVLLVSFDTLIHRGFPKNLQGRLFGLRLSMVNLVFLLAFIVILPVLSVLQPKEVLQLLAWLSLGVGVVILLLEPTIGYLLFCRLLSAVLKLFFRLEVEGQEQLRGQSVILAGNHTGFLDAPILMAAYGRPIRFLVAQAVFAWPLVGALVERAGMIPVIPGKERRALIEAIQDLNEGKVIGIFPEGKLTEDGHLGEFHRGVALLQQRAVVSIIPFVIQGGFEAWGWGQPFPKLGRISIQFGAPMPPSLREDSVVVADLRDRVAFLKASQERREAARHASPEILPEAFLSLIQLKSDAFGAHSALETLSYVELSHRAKRLSDYLLAQVASSTLSGRRIAIIAESSPEWAIVLFAIWRTGATAVLLDPKLTDTEMLQLLALSGTETAFVSPQALQRFQGFVEGSRTPVKKVYALSPDVLQALYTEHPQHGVERQWLDPAALIYTSGTTGEPKGVLISFQTLVFEAKQIQQAMQVRQEDVLVSMLPLHHLLELTGGLLTVLYSGGRVHYSHSLFPEHVLELLREKEATLMITVPAFLTALYQQLSKEYWMQSAWNRFRYQIGLVLDRVFPIWGLRRLLFGRIHRLFGRRFRGFVVGGAAIPEPVERFFETIGIPVYSGYGLTETGPVISVNTPQSRRLGTVGKPLPGVDVQLAEDGEILTRGPHVMLGYDGPTAKASVSEQPASDWFATGDLGVFDADGFLRIVGRKKTLLVLGSGKKVSPESIEAVLMDSGLFIEVAVLLQPDPDTTTSSRLMAVCRCVEGVDPDTLLHNPQLMRVFETLSPYKRPTVWQVWRTPLPRTISGKIRRGILVDQIREKGLGQKS